MKKIILFLLLTAAAPGRSDEADLDRKADPCTDFYQFACGGWIAKAEIPPDRAGWSRGFYAIDKKNEDVLRQILEDFAAGKAQDKEQAKLGDVYAACMDEAKIESTAAEALKRRLAPIEAIKDLHTLALQIARAHLEGANALFGFGNTQDAKDSSLMISEVDQAGLSLPDCDYYLKQDGKFPEIRRMYRLHVEAMLKLAGYPEAKAKAGTKTIVGLETELAKISMDRVLRRDPHAVYHRLERAGLEKLTPTFPWADYFAAMGVPHPEAMNVAVPDYFTGLEKLLKSTPMDDLRVYLAWHVLARSSGALSKRFVDEDFKFSSKAFSGQPELPPRWKRCIGASMHAMSHALSKAFVAKTFDPASKADARDLIKEVEATMAAELKNLTWMDEPTRTEARTKLDRVVNHIGYPDKWRDYAGLKVSRTSNLENSLAASIFGARYELAKIGRPVDRSEWGMPPTAVNAYYSAEDNKMVFPAGILQPPFYAHSAPVPVNYGAIGMVMGHELTHGFDDQGRKFDSSGNLRDWWTPPVAKEFERRAQCLVDQYSGYEAVEGMHVNGKMTLGENIADQGGLKLAYGAWLAKTGGEGPEQDGFNAKQQFFLGFAQAWCTKMRPEAQRTRIVTDPHSPPRFRVNGPAANFDEFAKAFSCKEGAPLAPTKRCLVW